MSTNQILHVCLFLLQVCLDGVVLQNGQHGRTTRSSGSVLTVDD